MCKHFFDHLFCINFGGIFKSSKGFFSSKSKNHAKNGRKECFKSDHGENLFFFKKKKLFFYFIQITRITREITIDNLMEKPMSLFRQKIFCYYLIIEKYTELLKINCSLFQILFFGILFSSVWVILYPIVV